MKWYDKVRALAGSLKVRRAADELAAYHARLAQINLMAAELAGSSDEALRQLAQQLRALARAGVPLNEIAAQVFALVREVAARTIGLRPFDVQIVGGLALHEGKIVQMQTGEGKTLTAVAPVVLNALTGDGVHVLTFNDYLARRDAEWMGPIYRFMGLRVGFVQEGLSSLERRSAYQAEVTYATAKEAGFDYLRDGLVVEPEARVQRPFHLALVDEADSILIDEARIPLVIAGTSEEQSGEPERAAAIVRQLAPDRHYAIDHDRHTVYLTEAGIDRAEALLGGTDLHRLENLLVLTELNAALYAAALMRPEVDYIVRNGRAEIVDEFTGRVVQDRHWPNGLQAAIEAREGLRHLAEGRVLGQITLQHFLRQYPQLCGMTATAKVAADELSEVYGLQVQVVPPNRPCIRADEADVIFTHQAARQHAVVEEIHQVHATGRPILVGTLTVEESEQLAARLKEVGISCRVLNARSDDQEARIVAQAGRLGAVTISTNMAGRGTDIRLGGTDGADEDQVIALGGLYVIGTNRHESRRVDDQLRGRAGRQGDPGSSRFFVSLEDDLLTNLGVGDAIPAKYRSVRQAAPIADPAIQRAIARAQHIVEVRNFEVRRALWAYSYLVEQQRHIVYQRRQRILTREERSGVLLSRVPDDYARVSRLIGDEATIEVERRLMLQALDHCWADHLATVDDIQDGIHLVAVGGLSPLEEFQKAVVRAFERFFDRVDDWAVEKFATLSITSDGIDLEAAELQGPSSTWTYLVEDMFKDPIAAMLKRRATSLWF